MVTGKNKEQFERWYIEDFEIITIEREKPLALNFFYNLPFEMQIGVFLAYYDTTKYKVLINNNRVADWYFYIRLGKNLISSESGFKTRNEAYKKALKEMDELINKEL